MNRSVFNRGQELDFLYLCRAIFHGAVIQGTRMPFFNNCILRTER
ncbi:RAxF-45 family protein [Bacillus tianshenii]|nr:RAxF-45 family protein [Bacillus tianshenii]